MSKIVCMRLKPQWNENSVCDSLVVVLTIIRRRKRAARTLEKERAGKLKASKTLHSWFTTKEAPVGSPPVANSAQERQQGAGSEVACLDEVDNESLPEPSDAGDNTSGPVVTTVRDPEVVCLDEDTTGSPDEAPAAGDDDHGDNGDFADFGGIDDIDEVHNGVNAEENLHGPCPGFRPELVDDPPLLGYPFGLRGQHDAELGWKVQLSGTEVRLFATSGKECESCTGKSPSAGAPCKPCADLEFSPRFQGEYLSDSDRFFPLPPFTFAAPRSPCLAARVVFRKKNIWQNELHGYPIVTCIWLFGWVCYQPLPTPCLPGFTAFGTLHPFTQGS